MTVYDEERLILRMVEENLFRELNRTLNVLHEDQQEASTANMERSKPTFNLLHDS